MRFDELRKKFLGRGLLTALFMVTVVVVSGGGYIS